jgi:2-oxoglutarate dehydrogenase E2 component (dihydrolipoamide succinyltransferase)
MRRLLQLRQTRYASRCPDIWYSLLRIIKIDVAVNAPAAGTIKEFLANEEDTVTVGQDLVRIELGDAPADDGGKKEASSEPKEPASKEQTTSSDPVPQKKEDSKPSSEEKKSSPPPQESPKKEAPPPKKTESKGDAKSSSSAPTLGSREERRVSFPCGFYA